MGKRPRGLSAKPMKDKGAIDMKLSVLLEGLEVLKTTADPEQEITGVSYDSRATAPGDLSKRLFALRSETGVIDFAGPVR